MPDTRRLDDYVVTEPFSRVLRLLGKFGVNLANYAGLKQASVYSGFGNGAAFTVANWISAQPSVFADLAAVQAEYPICQGTSDRVDWVLLQTALDDVIYGNLDPATRGATKGFLLIPAGLFDSDDRTLHGGYARVGTPPADLNTNGYISFRLKGEGPNYDPNNPGMTGTALKFSGLTRPAIAISLNQQVRIEDMTIQGPMLGWIANNLPIYAANYWDRPAYGKTGLSIADANWIGGAAVNGGVLLDPYSSDGSAAAYPARPLPADFGGGTTTARFSTAGGSGMALQDVNISGFVVGYGRVHGDGNGEYISLHRGKIGYCVVCFCIGHSQNRNVDLDTVDFEAFHTAISNIGGTQTNAEMMGKYNNLHFNRGYQIFAHENGDWSGPIVIRDSYAESLWRIGRHIGQFTLDGGRYSWADQTGTLGSVHCHHQGDLALKGVRMRGRDGLFVDAEDGGVHIENFQWEVGSSVLSNDNAKLGPKYMNHVFSFMGPVNRTMAGTKNTYGRSIFGTGGRNTSPDEMMLTHIDQEWADYSPRFPSGSLLDGSLDAVGQFQPFRVPKIGRWQQSVNVTSRSGLALTCVRSTHGDLKADVGDVFAIKPTGTESLRDWTWFCVDSISGSNMLIRQLNNFYGTSQFDYQSNGRVQVGTGDLVDSWHYICTRIRRNPGLIIGDVTSGSNVITNVKFAFSGSGSGLNSDNLKMAVGDYFIHTEIDRGNASGSLLKSLNLVTAIDTSARTITLTNNFNITRTNYPVLFFVKVFNA